jgi:predicted O-methyltransferase YrrM
MYQEPSHIYSSYSQNNIGETIYNTVIKFKPKKIIDFGLLYGYSTVCLAQAVRDNGFGEIIAYDLFEEYKYKNSTKKIVEYNLQYYDLNKYVTLIKKEFNEWLKEGEDFDLLHLDISNNGNTINKIYQQCSSKKIIFEGGTKERDNIEWMEVYNHKKIEAVKQETNYKILNHQFPGLSGINID